MKSRAKQVLLVFFTDVSFMLTRVIGTLVCLSVLRLVRVAMNTKSTKNLQLVKRKKRVFYGMILN